MTDSLSITVSSSTIQPVTPLHVVAVIQSSLNRIRSSSINEPLSTINVLFGRSFFAGDRAFQQHVLDIHPFIYDYYDKAFVNDIEGSGRYSSGLFDIHKEPEQLIRAIAEYAMMNDEELGLGTFVERNGGNLFVTITEDATGKEKTFQLEQYPLFVQWAIFCRGTNCYCTEGLLCLM